MNLNSGELNFSAIDSTILPNQKHDMPLNQKRMLTTSEIKLLQKDKRDSFDKMLEIMRSIDWHNGRNINV